MKIRLAEYRIYMTLMVICMMIAIMVVLCRQIIGEFFLWIFIVTMLILMIFGWLFMRCLANNITKLQLFAAKAAHNESLEVEELAAFSNDELGDIAERIVKIYKRLQTTRQEQDRIKRELTQNIAHELKTPVASIQGYLDTIISNKQINEATKQQFLHNCFAQSKRLSALLHDVSLINSMEDASKMLELNNVDVSEIVANIVRECDLELRNNQMIFVNQLRQGIIIKGNDNLLYSIFRNLTDNALHYAGKQTTITVTAKERKNDYFFTFTDNGVGVTNEHLDRLFERFYRIDKGRSRKLGGTGLGLAIVKNAVLVHGGTIHANNVPEGGLQFAFNLKKRQ